MGRRFEFTGGRSRNDMICVGQKKVTYWLIWTQILLKSLNMTLKNQVNKSIKPKGRWSKWLVAEIPRFEYRQPALFVSHPYVNFDVESLKVMRKEMSIVMTII